MLTGSFVRRRIHQLLEQVDQGTQVVATEEIPLQEDITVPRRDSDLTAWVNVIHGCNERCTYCVVPNTRGNEQSRLPTDIRVRCTMRFGSTAKVPANCKLEYYRISECVGWSHRLSYPMVP